MGCRAGSCPVGQAARERKRWISALIFLGPPGMHCVGTSLLYWTYFWLTALVLFPVALAIWVVTFPFDSSLLLLHRFTCWWSLLYLRCLPGCHIRVEGAQGIVPGTTYVIVANHQSMSDVMALSALPFAFKWVSKKENFRIPLIGWNMYLNRCVRVDRGNLRNVAKTMNKCRHWLARGISLLMFPEGHRSTTGEIQPFHSGAFKLALSAKCPIVPVVVDGTLHVFRGFRVSPSPGLIRIRVLDAIPGDLANGDEKLLRTLTSERMRVALAQMRAVEC
jgi:1-acyl-sn-glycerol-3-phosphate acyltransferase